VLFCFFSTGFAFASSTDGTISSTYKYSWTENAGWLNFGTSEGNIHITDSALTGYVWGENIGWISLNCSNNSSCGTVNYGVSNDGNGNLSGYAWSENAGWINFNPTYGGVSINSSGEFSGYAWGENIGWIIFSCSNSACVKTDWLPINIRGGNLPIVAAQQRLAQEEAIIAQNAIENVIPVVEQPVVVEQPIVVEPIVEAPIKIIEQIKQIPEQIAKLPAGIVEQIKQIPSKITDIPKIIKEIFTPEPTEPVKPVEIPVEELVSKEAPLALKGAWQLLPVESIKAFVLSPLPKEILDLAEKFPELAKTLKAVGINKITDLERLIAIKLTLPGLTERAGLKGDMASGKFALSRGIPLANLSVQDKQNLPNDIVFAKTGAELIDFNIGLSINEKGETQQRISTISGKQLQLAVKPDKPVRSVMGYVVFRSRTMSDMTGTSPVALTGNAPFISIQNLTASVLFAMPVFAKQQEQPIEEKLVLQKFEYTDPDKDGIYTAEINAPLVEGEYEIITVMNYEDLSLGSKEIRLITVVDPEGYVYERIKNQELRITEAMVSLYWLNPQTLRADGGPATKQYELWPAKEYQQKNPQKTDVTGKYSFLVPPGNYYIKVEAVKYPVYQSDTFSVEEGSGIHMNIELKGKKGWLNNLRSWIGKLFYWF